MTRIHPGADPDCPHCAGLGAVVVRDGEVALAKRCTCLRSCPKCHDTGWISAGDGPFARRARCTCTALTRRLERFESAQIPARHAASTRASFKPTEARQAAALVAVSAWLDAYRPREENRGMVLFGDVGRGKTHLMIAMLRELVFRYGVSVRFVEFSHLLADLKSGFDHGQGSARLIDPLVKVDVLAIDELGKGRNTEFEGTVLDELVSRRYNAAGTILATTNYAPGTATGKAIANPAAVALGAAAPPALVDRVGPRVNSRLQEMCDFVQVVGADWRERTRELRRAH
ncbi:MAG: ATP-binding protein [Alphaproteobacteria bacterium]|nr:ATP-binding protein [Alphaproteobacteria bacterium]